VAEAQRPPASDDAAASTTMKTDPLSEKQLKDLLKQFDSYRRNPSAEAVSVLESFLDHDNRTLALEAIEVLRFIALGGEQREAVVEILKAKAADPSYSLRDRALYAAAEMAKADMLPIVAGYIENPDQETQTEGYDVASRALAIIRNQETVPYLKDLLFKVKDPEIRRNCYDTLATIDSFESLSILKAQMESSQGSDQIAGAAALARMQNPDAIGFLAESIQARNFSPETIARLSSSLAAPDLFNRLLNNGMVEETQKIELLDTVAEYSVEGDSELREKMTDMLAEFIETSNSSEIKARAIKAIGAIGEERAPEIMQSYFNSDDADLRKEAFFNFAEYTDPFNYDSLFGFLWDEDEKVRRTAMVSLERFAGYEDIEMLEKAAQHDDEFIRKHARSLLSEFN
jgi:HEAT repeat protein